MLSNMRGNDLAVLRGGMSQYPLNEIVAILVASNINQRDSGTVYAAFADSVKVSCQEISSADLQALLNYLGSILVHTVLCCVANDVVNCSASVSWRAMLTDVLDAPVSKLAMSNNIDVGEDLLNARTLESY